MDRPLRRPDAYEAVLVEFLDRRPRYLPEDVSGAVGELEAVGLLRWIDTGTTLELIEG